VGAGVGAGANELLSAPGGISAPSVAGASGIVDFFGGHQAGIATPTQECLQFAALDFVSESPEDLRAVLRAWSSAAALLSRGEPVGPLQTGDGAPVDTGESVGLGPSSVTVTFGFGRSLFAKPSLNLSAACPEPLVKLPAFTGDALNPEICDGDLGIQVCADDPQVAFHAVHDLVRLASPAAVPRWALSGFGRTANSKSQETPRNLMGFKDGTENIMVEDEGALDRFVWAVAPSSPAWMSGGSYMVLRRIMILFGVWDSTGLDDQERTFGRHKLSGAPLTGTAERDALDLTARSGGELVIPANAHVRLASPDYNAGQRILRRGYSFLDGVDQTTAAPSGGLMFICFQHDPRGQFIPIQRRLSENDALSRHTQHVGSAVFACPPGASPGGFVGEGLFG
jgi:deferrochelatase/peroxidase EfeB